MFAWNDEVSRWFAAASAYTGFHDKLATRLLPYLRSRGRFADFGCGAGMINMILAQHFTSVTCVDIAEEALAGVRAMAAARQIHNIETICADAAAISGTWDVILTMFYGQLQDGLDRWLPMCGDCLVAVVRADTISRMGPEGYGVSKRSSMEGTAEMLMRRGVRYTLIEDTLEYGQPFETREEAGRFIATFSQNPPDGTIQSFLDRRLVQTGDARYPLYLPNAKQFGIFIIRRADNAHI